MLAELEHIGELGGNLLLSPTVGRVTSITPSSWGEQSDRFDGANDEDEVNRVSSWPPDDASYRDGQEEEDDDEGEAPMQDAKSWIPRTADDLDGSSNRQQLPESMQAEIRSALEKLPAQRSPEELELIWDHVISPMEDPFLMKMGDGPRKALAERVLFQEAPPGRVIMDYGETGDQVFLLYKGKVQIDVPSDRVRQRLVGGLRGAATGRPGGAGKPGEVELATLKCVEAGKVVGDRAFLSSDNRRNARVTTLEETWLLSITREDYQYCLTCSGDNIVQDRMMFLSSLDRASLAGIDQGDLQALATHLEEESYIGEKVILKQGDAVDKLVFVKSGFCKVVRELNPRCRPIFRRYADESGPPPNPFADEEESDDRSGAALLPWRPSGSQSARQPGNHLGSKNSLKENSLSKGPSSSRSSAGGSSPRKKALDSRSINNLEEEQRSIEGMTFQQQLAKILPKACPPARSGDCQSGSGPPTRSARAEVSAGGSAKGDIVHVNLLGAGSSFGTMELFEGLNYQCSLVASPWAVLYVVSKYDLIRNTPKSILHRLFTDYKLRLSDDRILQRLKQKNRWNNYKKNLIEDITMKKYRERFSAIDRRVPAPGRNLDWLSEQDYQRIGGGESLWTGRATTPPPPVHTGRGGQDILHMKVVIKEDGHRDVELLRERRDASMIALDERVVMMTSTARMRDRLRRQGQQQLQQQSQEGVGDKAAGTGTSAADDEATSVSAATPGLSTPSPAASPGRAMRRKASISKPAGGASPERRPPLAPVQNASSRSDSPVEKRSPKGERPSCRAPRAKWCPGVPASRRPSP